VTCVPGFAWREPLRSGFAAAGGGDECDATRLGSLKSFVTSPARCQKHAARGTARSSLFTPPPSKWPVTLEVAGSSPVAPLTLRTLNGQTCANTSDLYERGHGCRAAAVESVGVSCEVGGPSLSRRSRCGAGGLIGAAAAHSSPGQAPARCRSEVGARGKRLRAVGPWVLAQASRFCLVVQAACASSSRRTW
jgi:hypothetical protein